MALWVGIGKGVSFQTAEQIVPEFSVSGNYHTLNSKTKVEYTATHIVSILREKRTS
jgi:hypothetical protein